MAAGDAAWYSGHGRYGTGPDFDRNFIEFRLRNADGALEQTLDDYDALEHVLAKGGKDPWKVFQQRVADGTLEVDLSNAGNVRIADHAHSSEFGAKLINWALAKTGTKLQTGAQGQLAEDAAKSPQRYRVLAFYGCSTNSYDKELRATEGFNTKQADILVTNRVTRGGADVAAFMSFLDGLVSQTLGREDAQRRQQGDARERAPASPATPGSSPARATTPGSEHARARTEPEAEAAPEAKVETRARGPHRHPRAAAHDRQRRRRAAAAAAGDETTEGAAAATAPTPGPRTRSGRSSARSGGCGSTTSPSTASSAAAPTRG